MFGLFGKKQMPPDAKKRLSSPSASPPSLEIFKQRQVQRLCAEKSDDTITAFIVDPMIYIDFQKEIDAWTSEFGAEFKIDASFLPNMRFNQFYFLGPGRQAPGYDDFLLEQLTRIHKSNLTNSQKGEAFYKIVDVASKGVKDGSIIIVELF